MTQDRLDEAEDLLREALAALRAATGPGASTDDLVRALRLSASVEREAQQVSVGVVAAMQRQAVFAASRQRPAGALADLLGAEFADARRLLTAAEHTCARTDLQGQQLPPLLPATAAAFDSGAAGLRHVEVIARLMAGPSARRLDPATWSGAEAQIAAVTGDYTPGQLHRWGADLLSLLDQDGAEPDEREPELTNELFLTLNVSGSGGRLKGRFDDAGMYELIAAVLDAKSAPLTADDERPLGQRQAEAMAAVFGYVADHGDSDAAPAAGGRRPHISVIIRLEDLEKRARAACLDFAGVTSPTALRLLCCDARVVPVVLGGAGQPLDVGRATRTIPDGLRRAVTARDRGCAHPGCDRPPSWCEVHHIAAWELGGETRLTNLVMLCPTHHREIHFSGWRVRIDSGGIPEFFPPAWIDPQQRARRRPPALTPSRPSGPAPSRASPPPRRAQLSERSRRNRSGVLSARRPGGSPAAHDQSGSIRARSRWAAVP